MPVELIGIEQRFLLNSCLRGKHEINEKWIDYDNNLKNHPNIPTKGLHRFPNGIRTAPKL